MGLETLSEKTKYRILYGGVGICAILLVTIWHYLLPWQLSNQSQETDGQLKEKIASFENTIKTAIPPKPDFKANESTAKAKSAEKVLTSLTEKILER